MLNDRSETLPPIGVIGLGLLGSALCERLLNANYPVFVYNRTREKARLSEQAIAYFLQTIRKSHNEPK